jgi:two-component system, NarL family, sensor kinase
MQKIKRKYLITIALAINLFAFSNGGKVKKYSSSEKNNLLNYYNSTIDSLTFNKIFIEKDILNIESLLKSQINLSQLQQLKFNNYLSYYHLINNNLFESIKYSKKNIAKITKTTQEQDAIGYSYYFLANCLLNQGNNKSALINTQKAINIFEKLNNIDGLTKCNMLLANIYFYLKTYADAENIIDNGLKYFENKEKNNNYYMLLLTKIKILRAYKQSEAIELIINTYHDLKNNNKIDLTYTIDTNIYYIEFLIENNKQAFAKQIILETAPLVAKKDAKRSTDMFNWILADFDFSTDTPLSNRKYFIKRITESEESQDYQNLTNIYHYLKYDAYLLKDFEKLYEYSIAYDLAIKKISNDETKAEMVELKTKYESEKKEQLLAIKELQIDKKNKTIFILFSATILLFLLGLLLYSFYKNRRRKENEILKNHFTNKLLENIEEERKRIAKDLHDGVNHELLTLKNSNTHNKLEIENKIDSIIEDIRAISRNLHPAMFEKIGLAISVKNLIEQFKVANDFFITCEVDYFNSLKSSDEIQLFRVIQEALTNVIKYSNAHAAKVTIIENTKLILVEIKDNGIGFNVEEKLKSKKSFGIHSIIERVHSINGDVNFISNKNGTIIKIKIKK